MTVTMEEISLKDGVSLTYSAKYNFQAVGKSLSNDRWVSHDTLSWLIDDACSLDP